MTSRADLSIINTASRIGASTALVIHEREYSFAELAQRAEGLFGGLGAAPGPLGLVAEPTLDALVALYACLHQERAIALLHPAMALREREEFLDTVGCRSVLGPGGRLGSRNSAAGAPVVPPGTQALLLTSGSSGPPKVVVLSKDNLVAAGLAANTHLPLGQQSRWALTLPFAHVGGLSVITRCLLAGAAPVVLSHALTTREGLREAANLRVTHLSVVPTQLTRMLASGRALPESIEAILVGGAPLPPELRAQALAARYPILATYGLTEMGSQVCTEVPQALDDPHRTPDGSAGVPLPGNDVTISAKGHLLVRGPALAVGYWGLSRADFAPGGWFDTGDLGHFDKRGRLHIDGRADNRIISGGENVSPEWVERCLCELSTVSAACVVGLADPQWGQRVVAAIVLAPGGPARFDHEETKMALRAVLPPFALPKDYTLIEELPLLATGKVDRVAVLELIRADLASPGPGTPSDAPIDPPVDGAPIDPS